MKSVMQMTFLLALAAVAQMAVAGKEADIAAGDKSIQNVVKLLNEMLAKSKEEGAAEKKLYDKFNCYCTKADAGSQKLIKEEKQNVDMKQAKIEMTQGKSGTLSSELADLKANLAENEESQKTMQGMRAKEKEDFDEKKKSLTSASTQMDQALQTLSAVGADQTAAKARLKKTTLLSVKSAEVVSQALAVAMVYMTPEQQKISSSFLQGNPGAYSAQSGQVVGIIKDMQDTFKAELKTTAATEAAAVASHNALMKVKQDTHTKMDDAQTSKQKALSANDESLESTKELLAAAIANAVDMGSVRQLQERCAHKTKSYGIRSELRATEEAAFAEAITVLDSDEAFATFDQRDATKRSAAGGSASNKAKAPLATQDAPHDGPLDGPLEDHHDGPLEDHHDGPLDGPPREGMLDFLQNKAKVAAAANPWHITPGLFLQMSATRRHIHSKAKAAAPNAFKTVLSEINEMLKVNAKEEQTDKQKIENCDNELKASQDKVQSADDNLADLDGKIATYDTTISDETKAIADQDAKLDTNQKERTTETSDRQTSNQLYRKEVKNAQQASALMNRAIKVLSKFYSDLKAKMNGDEMKAHQAAGEATHKSSTEPETFLDTSTGQSGSTTKNKALDMLEFIAKETTKEELVLHEDENKEQVDFEDSMASKKKLEDQTTALRAKSQTALAETQLAMNEAKASKKTTEAEKKSIQDLMAQNKVGCDFVSAPARAEARAADSKGLTDAQGSIKGTDAYQAAAR